MKDNADGDARIVFMSSVSGYGPPSFNSKFFDKRGGNLGDSTQASYERYHQSKLANLLFVSALDEKLRNKGSKVKAIACTPGVCGSDMFLHATSIMSGGRQSGSLNNVPSVEDGSMAQLKCIMDTSTKVQSGDLWGPSMKRPGAIENTPLTKPAIMIDEASKEALWKACEDAVGKFEL